MYVHLFIFSYIDLFIIYLISFSIACGKTDTAGRSTLGAGTFLRE